MKTIRNKTYSNFMCVANWIIKEKHYPEKEAYKITHNLFESLEHNPGGNIWIWAKMIVNYTD